MTETERLHLALRRLREVWSTAADDSPEQAVREFCSAEATLLGQALRLHLEPRRLLRAVLDLHGEDARESLLVGLTLAGVRKIAKSRGELPEAERLQGYLNRVAGNLLVDELRAEAARRVKGVTLEGQAELAAPPSDDGLSMAAIVEEQAGLRTFFEREVVRHARIDNRLLDAFDRLWALRTGLVTIEQCAHAEIEVAGTGPPDSASMRRALNRIHATHTQVRKRLLEALEAKQARLRAQQRPDQREQLAEIEFWLKLTTGPLRERSASSESVRQGERDVRSHSKRERS